ncbi:MAG TPA: diacylglycerol kinase family protein [Pirellulales bacterium]|nr:diacylglycerol kinase family protein [Pirellulales bacterium]
MLVLTNSSAGARPRDKAVGDLVKCLQARGLKAEVITDLSLLGTLANRYHAEGRLRAVVAAGGDGTIAEIVNRTLPEVPVTIYPLGTANLLASYFKIECDPLAVTRTVLEGAAVRLDAGQANGRVFLLMAGCGFDADVVTRLHRTRGGRNITYWTYAKPILESIPSYQYPDLRVYCDLTPSGESVAAPLSARWAFVANLPCYAAGLQLAPGAVGTDGLLDVCTFGQGTVWHGLRYLSYVALGRHQVLPDCQIARTTRLRIESDQSVPYQLDGDPGGFLPLDIEVLGERLTLLAPQAGVRALGLEAPAESRAGAT